MFSEDIEKYKNAILYLCSKSSDSAIHGKKKLAKLLYFADFDRFEYEESMQTVTGDSYSRLPMGPVPSRLDYVTTVMGSAGSLKIEERNEYGLERSTIVYEATAEPDVSVFVADDLFILDRVASKYLNKSGKQLEDLSHAEAPWIAVAPSETIPFELAFYRDTDFADAK